MNKFLTAGIASLGLLALNAPSAAAQTAYAPAEMQQGVDDRDELEARIDNGLKNFGYIAGLSRGCVAEDQQVAFERDVLEINASIARLLGVDRAFLFSSAFGYGTSVEIERENCAEVLSQYETRSAKYRSAVEGA
ncbi:hypothetical protein [Erythrobacter sp.]|uniref:hypothetical protein n=1 Tax=Erythrobacter sp. TaxID=1042 RepID=UPI001425BCB1|nr:hypothetical protein [Erythrobacter sp.]QIQ86387.1 MAG: hypothetical protein G9473_06585 [Erythrobacter sp.]